MTVSGGQRSLFKKKLQVCESQQSCLFVGDQILIFHHNLQINSLKILQCDFLICFPYFVSHSWGIPMMKITGLSHLFKWENLHNWWLTKYFFAPLYIHIYIYSRQKCISKCHITRIYVCITLHSAFSDYIQAIACQDMLHQVLCQKLLKLLSWVI